jgi:hypothetical protein
VADWIPSRRAISLFGSPSITIATMDFCCSVRVFGRGGNLQEAVALPAHLDLGEPDGPRRRELLQEAAESGLVGEVGHQVQESGGDVLEPPVGNLHILVVHGYREIPFQSLSSP